LNFLNRNLFQQEQDFNPTITGISAGPEENHLSVTATSDKSDLKYKITLSYTAALKLPEFFLIRLGQGCTNGSVTDDGPSHAPHENSYSVTFTIKVDDYGHSEPEVTSLILI
jgi:hypothetical protein